MEFSKNSGSRFSLVDLYFSLCEQEKIHIYTHLYTYIYIYIYTKLYVYIHTHTHIYLTYKFISAEIYTFEIEEKYLAYAGNDTHSLVFLQTHQIVLIRHRAVVTQVNLTFVREGKMRTKTGQYEIICKLILSFQMKI